MPNGYNGMSMFISITNNKLDKSFKAKKERQVKEKAVVSLRILGELNSRRAVALSRIATDVNMDASVVAGPETSFPVFAKTVCI